MTFELNQKAFQAAALRFPVALQEACDAGKLPSARQRIALQAAIETYERALSQAGAGGVVVSTAMIDAAFKVLPPDAQMGVGEMERVLEAALAASPSAGEPVAWRLVDEDGDHWWGPSASEEEAKDAHAYAPDLILQPLYATPPAPVQTASVEAVANELLRIAKVGFGYDINDADRKALRSAAAALSSPGEVVEALLARLADFDYVMACHVGIGYFDGTEITKEWDRLVRPAMERLKLAALNPAPGHGEGGL